MHNSEPLPFGKGQCVEDTVTVTDEMVQAFAEYSGDYNPLHIDSDFAGKTAFRRRVAHGMSYGSLFSRMIGMALPGPGALWMSQNFQFKRPVFIGDVLTLRLEVTRVSQSTRSLSLDCSVINQHRETVLTGEGEVMISEMEEPETAAAGPKQRIALVTGASRGIGAAIAERLSADGFQVVITYKSSRDEAEKFASTVDNVTAVQCDAIDATAMRSLVGQLAARFGKAPDTLVMCATSPATHAPVADGDFATFRNHFDTQVLSAHTLVSACLPLMTELGFGSIVAIGSASIENDPPPGMAPYLVSKAAVSAYMKCLAAEHGPKGIRANIVAPSMTDTTLAASATGREKKLNAAKSPLRRLALPNDVAAAVAYLVSDDASYINGHTLLVTGGSVM